MITASEERLDRIESSAFSCAARVSAVAKNAREAAGRSICRAVQHHPGPSEFDGERCILAGTRWSGPFLHRLVVLIRDTQA